MIDRKKFFDSVRIRPFNDHLTQGQIDGMEAMLVTGSLLPLEQLAYCLATAFWETGRTMQPVSENLNYTSAARIHAVWPSRFASAVAAASLVRNPEALANKVYGGRLGNVSANDGWLFRGRGFVQITGRDNYRRAGQHLGADLVNNPDKARDPDIAAGIMFAGMAQGWFTGKKLSDYFTAKGSDPRNARKIINGLDHAKEIEGFHYSFVTALKDAWGASSVGAPPPVPAEIEPVSPKPEEPKPKPMEAPSATQGFWEWVASLFRTGA